MPTFTWRGAWKGFALEKVLPFQGFVVLRSLMCLYSMSNNTHSLKTSCMSHVFSQMCCFSIKLVYQQSLEAFSRLVPGTESAGKWNKHKTLFEVWVSRNWFHRPRTCPVVHRFWNHHPYDFPDSQGHLMPSRNVKVRTWQISIKKNKNDRCNPSYRACPSRWWRDARLQSHNHQQQEYVCAESIL